MTFFLFYFAKERIVYLLASLKSGNVCVDAFFHLIQDTGFQNIFSVPVLFCNATLIILIK